ncbi:MAG: B12-binding domain-containing radical SAM protein, partial [Candidatus Omnitrophica bacterium]|nr:B12-binding domain-containing radical SAM protein [Candidatus Omnitrophota bacterium]
MKILLIVYDNDSYMHFFPQGVAYVASVLVKEGHQVSIYNQDKFHYPDARLTDYLDNNKFDVVGVGVIAGYYQYRKLLRISEAINRSKNRPFYVIGGHGPSPEPEFFLEGTGADVVVIGEGERTIVEVIKSIENGRSMSGIKGTAYLENGRAVINQRRPLIEDIDTIPLPAYELFPMEYYRLLRAPRASNADFVMPLLSGRGCTFKCTFCYRMDEGFRPRTKESIIDEIMFLKQTYGITYILFSDELLMSSKERTIDLCEAFIKAGLRIKWSCNGRLNYATREVLKTMKRSGCVFINYGIEAMDNQVLKNYKKGLTTDLIIKGVEATLKEGIS